MSKTIYVNSVIQKVLLHGELLGQISDGYWENSTPYNHYQDWCDAEIEVSEKFGTIGIRKSAKRNYNFTNSDLLDAVGDRMMQNARLYKTFPNLNIVFSSIGEYLAKGYDFAKDSITLLKIETNLSEEELKKIVNDESIYNKNDLIKDCHQIKLAFKTILD